MVMHLFVRSPLPTIPSLARFFVAPSAIASLPPSFSTGLYRETSRPVDLA
jgi:hypothetical protein